MNFAAYLAYGYTAQQILEFLGKLYPNVGQSIQLAQKGGKKADEIFDFLSKFDDKQLKELDKKDSRNPLIAATTRAQEGDLEGLSTLSKYALGAAATAGGIYGAAKGLPALANRGIRPSQIIPAQMGLPQTGQTPRLPSNGQAMQGTATSPPKPSGPPSQPQAPIPANQMPTNPINPGKIFDELGLSSLIKNMKQAGNGTKEISAYLNSSLSGPLRQKAKEAIKASGAQGLQDLLDQYLSEDQEQQQAEQQLDETVGETPLVTSPNMQQPAEQQQVEDVSDPIQNESITQDELEQQNTSSEPEMEMQNQLQDQPVIPRNTEYTQKEVYPKPQPKTGDIVTTVNGNIGEIKAINGKKALIKDNGKVHQIDVDEIEEPDEDVINTVQNLLKIPEVDKSSVVSLFTYDPQDNAMYIQYHNGETYKYRDLDRTKVEILADKLGIPITKGQNIFGAWSQDDKKSLGAALIKEIIKDPKYGKNQEGLTWNKLQTHYDYWKKLRKPAKNPRKKK